MPELLLELLSEEIPARMQARAAEDLKRLVIDGIESAGLSYGNVETFVSPRRLGIAIKDIPKEFPDLRAERRGPRTDAPEKALQGFLKSTGLQSLEQCEIRNVKGSSYYFAIIEQKGGPTVGSLSVWITNAVQRLSWPKSMRWGTTRFAYVRPLHNILAIFGGKVVQGALDCGGDNELEFSNRTRGHRFLAPKGFRVSGFADYREKLREAKVVLDPAERREIVRKEADKLAKKAGLAVRDDPGLLEEVTGLVEWPVVLMGSIDAPFMELPPEVLTATMRANQKYFALEDKDGTLAPKFVVVANMEARDGGKAIVAGNERVLRARLADARFFWDQDRKQSLASCAPRLKEVVFHAKLGTLDEKADRMEALAALIAKHVPGADVDRVRSAARLAKADLVTGMVGEFPELQGVMGRYYALHDGEHAEVADAIADHYSPQGPTDRCPSAPVSVAVALADRIDTLVGFFAIDEKPTGSKDPYALRRAALGVIRLVLENGLRLPLWTIFGKSDQIYVGGADEPHHPEVPLDLLDFIADRLKVALREQGVRHDLIAAVFAVGSEDDLVRLMARVAALSHFLDSEDGANLLVAYRRAANIVRIEEKKDETRYDGAPEMRKLEAREEKALNAALGDAAGDADEALAKEDFAAAMAALARLRAPVDAFFDSVTVNCEDAALRENRLRLLSRIRATMDRVADFSQIEGG